MVITMVIDVFDTLKNGTTITAHRFADELTRRGHDVRIVAIGDPQQNRYALKEKRIPIVSAISRKQGMCFAKPDDNVIRDALTGADVVHLFLPFALERRARKIAKEMGVPQCAAFHLQPENITYNIHLRWKFFARLIYRYFYLVFYRHFDHIHCPSRFIARQLRGAGYHARLHVISNGVDAGFCPGETRRPKEMEGLFTIAMTGRYAPEKSQRTLIDAVSLSKYATSIRLILPGQGPCERMLKRRGQALAHPPLMGFYTKEQLIDLYRWCDLYVHSSVVEIEAISCMEAFSTGAVPLIADSPLSATPQFALDDRSLFQAGDPKDLARKIDWWIEHPKERAEMSHQYAEYGQRYRLDRSVARAEEMFARTVKQPPRSRRAPRRFLKFNPFYGMFSSFFYFFVAIPILTVFNRIVYGLHIRGKQWESRFFKGGAVVVCNHVHLLDSAMTGIALFPKKVIFTSMEANFQLPGVGLILQALGVIPVPRSPHGLRDFFIELDAAVRAGRTVCFFPEGHLIPYCSELRRFKKGAFQLAVEAGVPILPVAISPRDPGVVHKLLGRPCLTLNMGEPLYADETLSQSEAVQQLLQQTRDAMEKLQVG